MAKRAGLAIMFVMLAVVLVLSYSPQIESAANAIDQANWQGYPIPPCFIDAKMCAGHVLGTDENGRDMLVRLVAAVRLSLGVPLLAAILELIFSLAFGILARREGLFAKFITMRLVDALSCFPAWPFILVVTVFASSGQRASLAPAVIAAITALLFSHPVTQEVAASRNVRDAGRVALNASSRDWVRILLLIATLDYFGFGIQPPTPSWGNMLANMQSQMTIAWWVAAFPAACLFGAALAIEVTRRRFLA